MEQMKKQISMYVAGLLMSGLLILPTHFQAQGIHKGMIITQATLAGGLAKENGEWDSRFYIYGESEYLATDHLGINGSVYANMGSTHDFFPDPISGDVFYHSLFFGPNYHFISGKPLDLYVGCQPGLSLLRPGPTESFILLPDFTGLAPNASLNLGAAWYGSFFHFYTQVRGITGLYANEYYRVPLHEIRLCFGLGFNFF